MTLGALRERIELFRELGVRRAAFWGPHLTEVELWPIVPDAGDDASAIPGGDEQEPGGALYRLNSRGARKAGGET